LSCIIYIGRNLEFNEFKNMSKDWSEMNVYKFEKYFLFHLFYQLKEPKGFKAGEKILNENKVINGNMGLRVKWDFL